MRPEMFLRIVFAVVSIPVVMFAVLHPGMPLWLLLLAFLIGGGIEMWRMTRAAGFPIFLPAALAGIFLFWLRWTDTLVFSESALFPVLFAITALTMLAEVRRGSPVGVMARAGGTLFTVLYVGFLGSYLLAVAKMPLPIEPGAPFTLNGRGLACLLLSVWASDSFAFFAGKNFGKRPLAPNISPKKTVEGLMGAIVGGALGLVCGQALLRLQAPSVPWAILIGALLGFFGQMGDLFESLIKRSCGVKDSSNILPGHGGILDRIDALIFCAPIYYYLMRWLI